MKKFIVLCLAGLCLPLILFPQNHGKPLYPVILIHGWAGDETSWTHDNGDWTDYFKKLGWTDGGRLDFTLEAISLTPHDPAAADVVYMGPAQVPDSDFYEINFNINRHGDLHPSVAYYVQNILSYHQKFSLSINSNNFIEKQGNPANIHLNDIIAAGNELMRVTGIEGPNGPFDVQRGYGGTPVSNHVGNFKVIDISNLSNQASGVKQGIALKMAIQKVKAATGASKVILIGHSMGGAITARAYVQSEDYQHDVAKIITISSPHMGSNASDVNVFSIGSYKDYDLRSDAVRDLRYNRFPGLPVYPLPPPYPSANDNAPYLFGGPENSPWFENWLLGDLKFYSMDVDGDGIESSSNFIQGLNSKPWPEDVFLHCVITQRIQNGLIPTLDDDIVNCNRQYPAPGIVPSALLDTSRLNVSMATPFPIAILHTQAQDHIYQIMRGFDEPDQRQYAWEVPVNQAPDSYISGFTTRQTFNAASDEDWFKFTADRTGTARVQISEIHNEAIWHLAIFKNSDTSPVITQNQSTKPGNLAEVFFDVEEGETIYIRFVSEALPDSYQKPYLLKVNTGQGVSTVNVTASQYANVDVFSMVSITVHALDYAGDPVPGARLTLSTNNDGYFSNLPFNEITTDDQGMAMVSYVPRVTGSHLITATSVTGIEGNLPSPIQVITTNTPGNKIVQWEYWFDGNYSDRLLMGCYPSKILELSASIGINLLPEGLHTLNIRFRDKLGKWSYTTNDVFIKTSLEQVNTITSYQYWFDDPDQGITDNLITPGNQVNLIKNVNLLKLDAGLHSFNIRFRDKGGDYSNPVTQYFYYTGNQYPVDKITSYEYWFDDQITGREIVGIAETPNLNLVTGIPVNSLDAGLHVFNLRFKDRSGMYSSVSKTYFYKADEAGITQNKIKSYRYYFDNNNQDMTQVAEASAVSPLLLLKQVPVRVTSAGNHSFHIQFQDQNEKWSCLYTYSFTVTSQLSANFSADHVSVCTGSPVSFQNLSPGFVTSWQWEFTGGTPTTSGLPDPAVVYNAPGTYTVRLIVSNGTNHDTVTKTQYISVIQSPTVSWSTSVPTLCDNTTSYSLSGGTPAGGSYSGPGVTGTNLNPSLAGTGNQQILYRYTSSNGCTSSVAKTVQIAPTPVVTWESVFPPVCSTTDPYPLTGALPEGGIYTGTGVIGGIIHPLIAGSGNQTLVYTYTSESGCTNSQTNPLTILSPPVVSATIIQDIEPGTQAGLSASGNNGSGSYLFSWTPGSLLNHAYWQNPTTVSLAQTTLFSVRVTDLSTYCASTPVNSLVRVTGTSPAVDLIADKDSTNPGDEILLTAFANTGNGQIEYRWYENSAYLATTTDPFITVSPAVTTNYQVIVHVTFEVVTNEGTSYFSEEGSDSVHITVNAVSTVTFTGNFPPVCPSSPVVPLTTGSPTGGTYSGTGVSGNGSTGFSFNPVGLIAGLYTITYSLMVNGETASATNQIEVKYAPVVTWPGPLPSVCHGSTPEILSGATPTGGVYRVNGLISGNFDPSMYPPGLVNLSYTYTDPFTGCSASGTNSITVFSLPPVTWDGFLYTMCENSASLDLTTAGVSPLGGIFSGNGVSGASFNPTNAGVGTHLITYTLIDINTGCTNSISRNITVDAIPNVTFAGNLPSVCPSSPNVVLNTGLPAGGYYSGTGVVGSGFDPAGLVQGIYTITYTYYTVNGCSAFATY
ncbi:MAG: PKD domain-containing protein [Bacteroidetes bacterium]|nr:PKD domain-containing protein [Bacteroidota bacterium]